MLNNMINAPFSANAMNVRLTPISGVPIVVDAGGPVTSIYATPCFGGDVISIWDNNVWKKMRFVETQIVYASVSTVFDVFASDAGAGLVNFTIVPWLTTFSRNIAVSMFQGVYTQTADPTKTLIGSFMTDPSGTDVTFNQKSRTIWNLYNRVELPIFFEEAAVTWTLGADPTNTYRQVNNNTANQLHFVVGLTEDIVKVTATTLINAPGAPIGYAGIGIDSTTTNSAIIRYPDQLTNNNLQASVSEFEGYISIGSHELKWLEAASANVTFVGNLGVPQFFRPGVVGSFKC